MPQGKGRLKARAACSAQRPSEKHFQTAFAVLQDFGASNPESLLK
ncbi:hypothetical protein [Neisseria sp.]